MYRFLQTVCFNLYLLTAISTTRMEYSFKLDFSDMQNTAPDLLALGEHVSFLFSNCTSPLYKCLLLSISEGQISLAVKAQELGLAE